MIYSLDENNFFETLNNLEEKVLVVFYSDKFLPCKTMRNILERFEQTNQDKKIYLIDIDMSRKIVKRYGIDSVPTYLIFEKGQPVEKRFGTLTISEIENMFRVMQY